MTPSALIVVDDDPDVALAARLALAGQVCRVDCVASLDALEQALGAGAYDAVLLDMNFVAGDSSGRAGLDGLARTRAIDPTLSVVLMTAYGGVALAVEALKRGAVDFVLKPWRNDKLAQALAAAAALTRARREALGLEADLDLEGIERQAIARALQRHGGNISKAAAALGLTRPALYRRMDKHGL
jgi:two-component system response regulator RegA